MLLFHPQMKTAQPTHESQSIRVKVSGTWAFQPEPPIKCKNLSGTRQTQQDVTSL